ncbi:MAG: 2-dehydropantoate 2-reductase [Alphaproteobacteria bacterium]
MKICIFGAGAVGSMLGGELARVGQDVTLIARGPHLAAMRERGLTVIFTGEERHSRPACTDNPSEAGPQDAVIFVVKAHQLAAAAQAAAPLIGAETTIVAAQNGIPWWYFHKHGGAFEGHRLNAVDPNGAIRGALNPERVLGAVINGSCAMVEPGRVSHHQNNRSLTMGAPDGTIGPRAHAVADAFADTDVGAPLTDDIRRALWHKLLSNLAGSMLSVLTLSNLGQVANDPGLRALSERLLREMEAVARGLGLDISAEVAARIADEPHNSTHKPSTLQDFEAGRPMEIDAITGAVAEMGRLGGTPTPMIDSVYALLRQLGTSTGSYPENPAFALDYGLFR